jgi:hypothetical protein
MRTKSLIEVPLSSFSTHYYVFRPATERGIYASKDCS